MTEQDPESGGALTFLSEHDAGDANAPEPAALNVTVPVGDEPLPAVDVSLTVTVHFAAWCALTGAGAHVTAVFVALFTV